MFRIFALAAALLIPLVAGGKAPAQEVKLKLDPGKTLHAIDEMVYGHFFEHIYHSANGGLWGEMIFNRSFEENQAGQWSVRGGAVVQRSLGTNQRLPFGDPAWTDYEFTLEARKTGGAEGFLILFRVKSDKDFYWANLGGWGNKRHGLERGLSGQERWGGVGRQVDGQIDAGRWYRIKVRCQGPHLQVWLDGQPVLELKDDAKAVLAGRVGVGTWATQAEFRNLRVASLDGKTLFEGLPEAVAQPAAARHWTAYGPGRVFLDADQPLNSRFSQKIVGQDGETGLQQTDVCLRKGHKYAGSLWARGAAARGLVVRVLDGQDRMAECPLPGVSPQWTELRFEFQADRDAKSATIQVGVPGACEAWIDQVSLTDEAWREAGGFRPDLLKAVADLRPPVIRWPGGCFAEFYRWKDGVGPQHKRGVYPINIWDDTDVNSLGTDEFMAMCRKVGAEPLVVINIGRHDKPESGAAYVREACDWIQYCNGPADSTWGKVRAANGHPEPYGVKFWEIDNETWGMGPENYSDAVREFVPAMKKADPAIKVLVCGSAGYGRTGHGLPWNRVLIERCADLTDYLSIHHYENPDRFDQGPRQYEAFFRETGALIAASKNPKMKIFVSEWNAQSTDWRTGLYAGGLLNAFERRGDVVAMGSPALFLRHVSAGAWDNAFINFDQCAWFPAPNYVVMKLWRDHYAPHCVALEGDCGPLNAVAAKSQDGKTVYFKAVNPGDQPAAVELTVDDGFPVGRAAMQLVAPDDLRARNTLDKPGAVAPAEGKTEVAGQKVRLTLPRWSAAVVTVQKR